MMAYDDDTEDTAIPENDSGYPPDDFSPVSRVAGMAGRAIGGYLNQDEEPDQAAPNTAGATSTTSNPEQEEPDASRPVNDIAEAAKGVAGAAKGAMGAISEGQGEGEQAQAAGDTELASRMMNYLKGMFASHPQVAVNAENSVDPHKQMPEGERKVAAVQAVAAQGTHAPVMAVPPGWQDSMQQLQSYKPPAYARTTKPTAPVAPGQIDDLGFNEQDVRRARAMFPSASQQGQAFQYLNSQEQQRTKNETERMKAENPLGIAQLKHEGYENRTTALRDIAQGKNQALLLANAMKMQNNTENQRLRTAGGMVVAALRDPAGVDMDKVQSVLKQFPDAAAVLMQGMRGGQQAPTQQAPAQQAPAQQAAPAQQQPQTRMINGHQYKKVQGGWQLVQ